MQRFNTMRTYWSRVVREIENGTYRRDVIRAAARFGDGALAALGQKKTKGLAAAVAKAQQGPQKRPVDDAFEIEDDDLIEDDADDELDAPTPPRLGALPAPAAPAPVVPLPAVPVPAPPVPAPPPQAALPPKRPAGLRLGGSAPPAIDVTKRVADLAAQLAPPRSEQTRPAAAASFGDLDLDFDEPPAPPPRPSPPLAKPATASASPLKPAPVAAPPRAAVPAISAFGVLDIPFDPAPPPAPLAPPGAAPKVPAPIARAIPAARPAAPVVPPPPPAPPSAELPDQRIRQIYAKYVETKRSTQESTAGVTFEKLAASLRAQADKLKSAHPNRSIDYEVVIKDGKTHLKPVLR